MKINFVHKGNFNKLERFLAKATKSEFVIRQILHKYGKRGVEALAAATPKDSGTTAQSWSYEVNVERGNASIVWSNSNVQNGVNIAILLQYGHGTRTGGYVQGIDFINPALKDTFDLIADEAWKEVS